MRRLEVRLGTALLRRTTPSVSPTDAEFRLIEAIRPALAMIDAGLDEVSSVGERVLIERLRHRAS